ncbi:reverse transcriptase domain-containing protein [Tanacetum coccineum]
MSTPDYICPIIVPSDSNVEDAFSSTTTPDYTPTSPDYFPASPGNTSPDPSDDLSKYLLASLAISPFHDDPYMKVMQAYNATSNELPFPLPQDPIAPLTVLPLSPIGESYHKTHLEHHEKHVKTILNRLDELPLERIENIEDKIKGLGLLWFLLSGLLKPLYLDIMDMINNQDIEHKILESKDFQDELSLQSTELLVLSAGLKELNWYFPIPLRIEEAYKITWFEFKKLLIKKYYPRTEVKKMEDEFYNLTIKGNDLKTYVRIFQELAVLCPNMVPNFEKLMEVFIGGLPGSIEGNVTASKPQTLEEAITIT